MANFWRNVEQISYVKILSIAVFLSVLLSVPVVYMLANNRTRLNSQAAYEKPEIATQALPSPGPVPLGEPVLGRVFPWVGKEGDIVWVQGENFGVNPMNKSLVIGGVKISDDDIAMWEDDIIQAVIPEGVDQGSVVEVKIGNHQVKRSLPLTIYSPGEELRLRKDENKIWAENAGEVRRAIVWTGDDEIATEQHVVAIDENRTDVVNIFNTNGLPLLAIVLLDGENEILPYAADPIEFDF